MVALIGNEGFSVFVDTDLGGIVEEALVPSEAQLSSKKSTILSNEDDPSSVFVHDVEDASGIGRETDGKAEMLLEGTCKKSELLFALWCEIDCSLEGVQEKDRALSAYSEIRKEPSTLRAKELPLIFSLRRKDQHTTGKMIENKKAILSIEPETPRNEQRWRGNAFGFQIASELSFGAEPYDPAFSPIEGVEIAF